MPRACALTLASLLLFAATAARADIKLPGVLADHMVLQRDQPVHLWGTAAPGEKIRAEFRGHTANTIATADGHWTLTLPKGEAGGPFALKLHGNNTITFEDVLVGDVWIASGQSNMELMIQSKLSVPTAVDLQKEIDTVSLPNLRLFRVTPDYADTPNADITVESTWTPAAGKAIKNFSAAAYFFGKGLVQHTKVPIGIIDSSLGSSPAEAWISNDAFAADPFLAQQISAAVLAAQQKAVDKFGTVHQQLGAGPDRQIFFRQSRLYNAMIAPLTPLPIKGVIWYQGEANSNDPMHARGYHHVFSSLITDWRANWHEGDFPFYFVQLASFVTKADWPDLRESQLLTLSLPHTGMAVTIDIGESDTIHPRDKWDVGERLALWACANDYGEKVEFSGPLFDKAEPKGSSITVHFTHGEGLHVAAAPATGVVVTTPPTTTGPNVTGFEVAGVDGKFVAATATIHGDTITASSPAVSAPTQVRYEFVAWPDPPAQLYNSANLPASPFTSMP